MCWVFVSVRGLSLVVASGGHSSSRCAGLSPSWPLLLWSTGSRRAGPATVAHGPSCSAACGIFPDQGSNPCPPHWQADSQPLRHQGSLWLYFFNIENTFLEANPNFPPNIILYLLNKIKYWDFPGGSVVNTWPSNAWGAGSISGWGVKIPHASGPKNQNIKQKHIVTNSIKT